MISHHHKTIYVHVPKCAGISIENAFLTDLGLDWDIQAPLLLRPNMEPRLGPPRLDHLTAEEYTYYKYISEDLFAAYYKFATVRSPVTRVVSFYNYLCAITHPGLYSKGRRLLKKYGLPHLPSFDRFFDKVILNNFQLAEKYSAQAHGFPGFYWFIRPQSDFLFSREGELMVDDVFKLEDITHEWPKIAHGP